MAVKTLIYWGGSTTANAKLDFAVAPSIGTQFVIQEDGVTYICKVDNILHAPTLSGSGIDPSIRCIVTRTKAETMGGWWWSIKETLGENLRKALKPR